MESLSKNFEWFDQKWFTLETFQSFEYENSIVLYFLGIIPLVFLVRFLLFVSFRQKIEVAFFTNSLKSHWSVYLRFIPDILMAGIMATLIIALHQMLHAHVYQSAHLVGSRHEMIAR